ncbi:hypothetical protein ANN_27652 [Periplaneta americana]|uniref:Per a allergen n=1 Tax=Periplaneta americana TaxID=6978 RepID=A0ABQ8RWH2_PERAM|nr:hypothetical protein ANN_27652 [Periplaneta americana]
MEHEVDPLAIDTSEKADTEEPNLSLIEGTFEAITVKEEVKWEVTSEEYEVLSTESYPPYLEAVSSIRNLKTRHAVVIGTTIHGKQAGFGIERVTSASCLCG